MPSRILFFILSCIVLVSCSSEVGTVSSSQDYGPSLISTMVSSPYIKCFEEDSDGHMWIGTDYGLNRYNGFDYEIYLHTDDPETNRLNQNEILSLRRDKKSNLWICTYYGLNKLDEINGVSKPDATQNMSSCSTIETKDGNLVMFLFKDLFLRYNVETDTFSQIFDTCLPLFSAFDLYPSSIDNTFWCITSRGAYEVNPDTGEIIDRVLSTFEVYSSESDGNCIWLLSKDGESQIIDMRTKELKKTPDIITSKTAEIRASISQFLSFTGYMAVLYSDDSVFFYNLENKSFVSARSEESLYRISEIKPSCFYLDSKGNLWIGSNGEGFEVCALTRSLFNDDKKLIEGFNDNLISDLCSDTNNDVWAITNNDLLHYSNETQEVETIPLPFTTGKLHSIDYSKKDNTYWISAGNSLYNFSYANNSIKLLSSYSFNNSPRKVMSFTNEAMLVCCLDNGDIALTLVNGVIIIKSKENKPIVFPIESTFGVYDILPWGDGKILVTANSINPIILDYNTLETEIIDIQSQTGDLHHIIDAFRAPNGVLYLGTLELGLYKYSFEQNKATKVDEVRTSRIASIEAAPNGNIWVSTAHGLYTIDNESSSVSYFDAEANIGGDAFSKGASCTLSDGTIIFGGSHGITTCNDNADREYFLEPIVFENLYLGTEIIKPSKNGIIEKPISTSDGIKLKFNHKNIKIAFSLIDIPFADAVEYSYCLNGLSDEWVKLNHQNNVTFSQLPAGRYTLTVKGWLTGSENNFSESSIDIRVLPAPYKSTFAYVSYLLIILALILYFNQIIRQKMKYDMEIEQSKREKEHEKTLNRMNTSFFANIAHELRTPLTIISGPIELLSAEQNLSPQSIKYLSIMKNSSDRMMKLINQLMDVNKLDNHCLELKVIKDYDIAAMISQLSLPLDSNAKNLAISTSGLDTPCKIPMDPDKVESIVSNLFSNALKFGQTNISIDFSVISSDDMKVQKKIKNITSKDYIQLEVSNDCEPIGPDELELIFDRYYQIRKNNSDPKIVGTGIGLSYARSLAVNMHGALWAENLVTNDGVKFTFLLPADEESYQEKDFSLEQPKPQDTSVPKGILVDTSKANIFVVDDDNDITNYLDILLSPFYNVQIFHDAESAFKKAKSKEMPDIILSDIIMPGMGGIEFCKRLKQDITTCHIPVILLTAKIMIDSKIDGLNSGADLYITKPFEPSFLLASIKSLIKNRNLVTGEVKETSSLEHIDDKILSSRDKDFLAHLYNIMDKEIANPDYDIELMCVSLNVSRTILFTKIKSLTQMSPNALFRSYRLNKAAQLLKEGKYNASEVASMVGFNSLSYFSRAFKNQFGISPKDMS